MISAKYTPSVENLVASFPVMEARRYRVRARADSRRGSSGVEQWTENPRVVGSIPTLGTRAAGATGRAEVAQR